MGSGLDNGFGAPFVRVFFNDKELSIFVESFEYQYDEEGDDVCKLEIKSESREEPDQIQWHEKTELKIIWGWIQGEISNARKVYIQQITWKFEKEYVSASIEATDKAVSLKYSDSREVHTDTSLPGLAYKMALKHKLKAVLELDGQTPIEFIIPSKPGEYFNEYLIRNNTALVLRGVKSISGQAGIDSLFKPQQVLITKNISDQISNPKNKKPIDLNTLTKTSEIDSIPRDSSAADTHTRFSVKPGDFRIYDNAPQANKTDAQMLNEYAMKENNGPYLVDTRDDEIVIRKRNFNQTPYKQYLYGGDVGDLVEFIPMTKVRSHKQKSGNVGFSNWNPLNKTTFSGNANGADDLDTTLGVFKDMFRFYSPAIKAGAGATTSDPMKPKFSIPFTGPGSTIANQAEIINNRSDATGVHNLVPIFTPFTIDDKVSALRKTIEGAIESLNNNTYDATGTNAVDAWNQANNARRSNELKMNPAQASIYGDPNLKVGLLITVMGISKKFSGNYYIAKATHKIDHSGYMTSLELCTQGTNLKTSPDHVRSKGKLNKNIGPTSSKNNAKKLKIKGNP